MTPVLWAVYFSGFAMAAAARWADGYEAELFITGVTLQFGSVVVANL